MLMLNYVAQQRPSARMLKRFNKRVKPWPIELLDEPMLDPALQISLA